MDIVVVVEAPGEGFNSDEWKRTSEKRLQDGTRAALSYQQKALARGVKAKVRVLLGKSAAEEIIKYQQSEKLDLIILGRRSHMCLAAFPMGAVSQRVVAYTPLARYCGVLHGETGPHRTQPRQASQMRSFVFNNEIG